MVLAGAFPLFNGCAVTAQSDATKTIKRPDGSNEVFINPNCIRVPIGNILLVKRDSDYCALKILDAWWTTDEPWDDEHIIYESYYQGDKSGDLSKENVEYTNKRIDHGIYRRIPPWWIFSHGYRSGLEDIRCGSIKLWWSGPGWIYFGERKHPEGHYGIEFAPTKWTDISEVNPFDIRLQWYQYDNKRKRTSMPIDQIWRDEEGKTSK